MFAFGVLLVILALGELTQASRYYEYCSRLAPPEQQGLYMGYAFLPIAIGYFVGGCARRIFCCTSLEKCCTGPRRCGG